MAMNNTWKGGVGGALSGALSGAMIGSAFGGPGIGTAIGAGVGLIGGIASGIYQDKAETDARALIEQNNANLLADTRKAEGLASDYAANLKETQGARISDATSNDARTMARRGMTNSGFAEARYANTEENIRLSDSQKALIAMQKAQSAGYAFDNQNIRETIGLNPPSALEIFQAHAGVVADITRGSSDVYNMLGNKKKDKVYTPIPGESNDATLTKPNQSAGTSDIALGSYTT